MKVFLHLIALVAFLAVSVFSGKISEYLRTSQLEEDDETTTENLLTTVKPPSRAPTLEPGITTPTNVILPPPSADAETYTYPIQNEAIAYLYKNITEYILVDRSLKWPQANLYCQNKFRGHLAVVDDVAKSTFLAEVLDKVYKREILWVNGKTSKDEEWFYHINRELRVPVDPLFVSSNLLESARTFSNKTKCLTISQGPSEVAFLQIDCMFERKFICERAAANSDMSKSHSPHETHPGWIQIGEWVYKLFSETLNYDDAASRCVAEDPVAALAVVLDAWTTRELGRYMMITRPALRVAWVGGIYVETEGWVFPNEAFVVPTQPIVDANKWVYPQFFPPRPADPTNHCLALLRLTNGTVFKEIPCNGTLPGYICYKKNIHYQQVYHSCANKRYELSTERLTYHTAEKFCRDMGALLAEPRTEAEVQCLSYAMTELPPTPLTHLWLGGSGRNLERYRYNTDQQDVYIASDLWLKNLTLAPHLNELYTCLNMDQLDVDRIVFYGTDCGYRQHFACQLEELEEDLK